MTESAGFSLIYRGENGASLYLGDLMDAANYEEQKARNIGAVLDCTEECEVEHHDDITYAKVPLLDTTEQDLVPTVFPMLAFIKLHLDAGVSVLVHCFHGVSRSASVCVAFIMMAHDKNFRSAYDVVVKARGIIFPNLGFCLQLENYEREIRKYKIPNLSLKPLLYIPPPPPPPPERVHTAPILGTGPLLRASRAEVVPGGFPAPVYVRRVLPWGANLMSVPVEVTVLSKATQGPASVVEFPQLGANVHPPIVDDADDTSKICPILGDDGADSPSASACSPMGGFKGIALSTW